MIIYRSTRGICAVTCDAHLVALFIPLAESRGHAERTRRGARGTVRPIRRIRGPTNRWSGIKQLIGTVTSISSVTLLQHEGKLQLFSLSFSLPPSLTHFYPLRSSRLFVFFFRILRIVLRNLPFSLLLFCCNDALVFCVLFFLNIRARSSSSRTFLNDPNFRSLIDP